jgi:hypothetical protein
MEIIQETVKTLPDNAAIEFYVRRGIDVVLHDEPWKHWEKEYALGKGMTITIKISGGARDGYCTEAEARDREKSWKS